MTQTARHEAGTAQGLVLGELLRRNARLYRDKPAFVMDAKSVTFGEYNRRVNRLVHMLRSRHIHRGDRIAILARNCLAYMDVYGAAEKGGFVAAPLNFRLTPRELVAVMGQARPRVLFAQDAYRDTVSAIRAELPWIECFVTIDGGEREGWVAFEDLLATATDEEPADSLSAHDLCYLIFTSGTTGLPRAAMLDHQGQWLDAAALALEMSLQPIDRHLALMPLYHIGGRGIVLAHTLRGCTVILHDGFDAARILGDVEGHGITTTQVVPTMIAWLLNEPDLERRNLTSLRLVWYASAPMPVELLRRALDVFGPIFMQGYGQTEAGPLVTTLHPHEHEIEEPSMHHLGSSGRPVPGADVRIVGPEGNDLPVGDIGEIVVRSPFLALGYWEDEEATAETFRSGWLYTGDMGRMDADGYVYLVDRKRDLIISGGENIYPREVEEVIYAHPAVVEGAVIGVPDPVWGETVKAMVVVRPDHPLSPQELITFCRDQLAHYKCPTSVEFRETLPKTPSGKILKRVLRDPYWQAGERKV